MEGGEGLHLVYNNFNQRWEAAAITTTTTAEMTSGRSQTVSWAEGSMAGNTWRARRGGQNPVLGGERFILAGQSCYSELVLENVGSIGRDFEGSIWRDSGGSLLSWGGGVSGCVSRLFPPHSPWMQTKQFVSRGQSRQVCDAQTWSACRAVLCKEAAD